MQYPIPQFIEEEGKIIFFMTFRQFFMLAGGGAVCLVIYFIAPLYIFGIATFFIMSVILIFAFVKINKMSLLKVIFNFLGFTMGAKSYVWKKKTMSHPLKIERAPGAGKFDAPALKIQTGKLKEAKKMVELTKR
ncbi:MAG: PrgI family protein [Patescibacteria group bacterium]